MKAIGSDEIQVFDFSVTAETQTATVIVSLEGTEWVGPSYEANVFIDNVLRGETVSGEIAIPFTNLKNGFLVRVEPLVPESVSYEKEFLPFAFDKILPTTISTDNKRVSVINQIPTVNNFPGTQVSADVVLRTPTNSIDSDFLPFSAGFQRGRFEANGTTVYRFDFGNRLYALIEYCIEAVFHVLSINHDIIFAELTARYKAEGCQPTKDITRAFELAVLLALGERSGFDMSAAISELETLLGIKGICKSGDYDPQYEAQDVIVEGCNVQRFVSGQTTKYVVDNFAYEIDVLNHRGTVSIQNQEQDCIKTTVLVFDFDKITKIVADGVAASIVPIVNTAMNSVNPKCVWPVDPCKPSWSQLSFAQKWQAIVDKVCSCIGGGTDIGDLVYDINCGQVQVNGDFFEGVPSSGEIVVPILWGSGSGTIQLTVSGSGFSGSETATITQNQNVTVPVTHNGTGTGTVQVNISGTDGINCQTEVELIATCGVARNLEVVFNQGNQTATIRFNEALNPPPSYQVLRRRESDPDVPSSYVVLPTPTYNIGLNKYVVSEVYLAALQNRVWVYKVESLCEDGSRPSVDTAFANIQCPVVSLSSDDTVVDASWANQGGDIDRYRYGIYQNGNLVGSITTINAPFTDPVLASFTGLTASTNYEVRVFAEIGSRFSSGSCSAFISTTAGYEARATNTTTATITNVRQNGSDFIDILEGAFPVEQFEEVAGTYTPFTGLLSITVGNVTDPISAALSINGIFVECIDITTDGVQNFTYDNSGQPYDGDNILINLVPGSCD